MLGLYIDSSYLLSTNYMLGIKQGADQDTDVNK